MKELENETNFCFKFKQKGRGKRLFVQDILGRIKKKSH